jgi:hypothetical protein
MQVHYWSLYKKCLTPTMCSVGAFDDISSQLFVTRMLPVFSFSRQSKPILPLRRVGLFISCGLISINALYSESRGFSPGTSVSYTAGTGKVAWQGGFGYWPFHRSCSPWSADMSHKVAPIKRRPSEAFDPIMVLELHASFAIHFIYSSQLQVHEDDYYNTSMHLLTYSGSHLVKLN